MINKITDGHHKLVRWNLITHAGIDGYSRMIVFLHCSNNNKASTVYDHFLNAARQYGLPSRVRTDQGRENVSPSSFTLNMPTPIPPIHKILLVCSCSVRLPIH